MILEDPKQVIAQSRLVGHPTVLSLMCAEACFAFLWYFWLSWMPSFFHDAYGLSTGEAGTLGMMIYWVGMPVPGCGVDVARSHETSMEMGGIRSIYDLKSSRKSHESAPRVALHVEPSLQRLPEPQLLHDLEA